MATGGRTELLEVHVGQYKNLDSVRLSWAQRQVLYGRNGAGKTNLLEAIALLFGSTATMWQVAQRAVTPEPGALSALVRTSDQALPTPPAFCTVTDPDSGQARTLSAPDQRFWELLGCATADATTWADAVREAVGDDRLVDLLVTAAARPAIRYTLEELHGLDEARPVDRGVWMQDGFEGDPTKVRFKRQFARTLVLVYDPPEWLTAAADSLPDLFAPFRRWLAEDPERRSPAPDLLELPSSEQAPVRAVWLAAERTGSEAWYDHDAALDAAKTSTHSFAAALDKLSVTGIDASVQDQGLLFWLGCRTAETLSELLQESVGAAEIYADDMLLGSIRVARRSAPGRVRDSGLDESSLFPELSSGERTWLDIGLAHAAARIEDISAKIAWLELGLRGFTDEQILDTAVELHDRLTSIHERDSKPLSGGYWQPFEIDAAVDHLERLLGDAEAALRRGYPHDAHQRQIRSFPSWIWPGVHAALHPSLEIHLYDEPERHLHPDAQRNVAQFLDRPGSSDVVVATHSHLFLGGSGWRHRYIERTASGSLATAFDPAGLDVTGSIAQQMGLTRGELLFRIRYVLFVEGLVDEIVLAGMYGDVLSDAGILVMPIHGVDEVKALAEMRILGRLVEVGAGLLVDHADIGALDRPPSSADTKEIRALRELRKDLKRRGRTLDEYGLLAEDITAYLDGDAIQAEAPDFPGWESVLADRQKRDKFKDLVERHLGGQKLGRHFVRRVVDQMRNEQLPARNELPEVVAQIVATARGADQENRPDAH